METADLTAPMFTDDEAARLHFEGLRWEGGVPVCFHCGVIGDAKPVSRDENRAAAQRKAGKKVARTGLYFCRSCGGQFTATMGTIYEDSHIPMRKWLLATHLMNSSKKGISALQLQRSLGLGSYRTAWFMAHRIREGMTPSTGRRAPMGGPGKVVEADETYHGKVAEPRTERFDGQPYSPRGGGPQNKRSIVALIERGGAARTFHVAKVNRETLAKLITENVHPASRLHTDESHIYRGADAHTASHETVKHSADEYVRGDVHVNSAESYFGVFKRGMTGVYQHCDEKYLPKYLSEFEFRFNHRVRLGYTDEERAALAVKGAVGKRLTLRQPKSQQAQA